MIRLKGSINAQRAIGLVRRFSSEAAVSEVRLNPQLGPSFKDFLNSNAEKVDKSQESFGDITESKLSRKFHVETYGCQMNLSDSEIVRSILLSSGHTEALSVEDAELIFVNTCAIRDNAEAKIWHRLKFFRSIRRKSKRKGYPKVGVLGCMAERLKDRLLEEEAVDIVCGPDAYRDLPRLLDSVVTSDQKEANTQLSFEETYADINPVRIAGTGSAFVSIMRGCNNMCSFCVVPFTRGRERSRDLASIVSEIERLVKDEGVKEVVLLGQNVNGFHDTSAQSAMMYPSNTLYQASPGFSYIYICTYPQSAMIYPSNILYQASPGYICICIKMYICIYTYT
jgi:hypothetical protein